MRIPRHIARYTFVPPLVRAQQGDDDRAKRVFPNLDDVPLDCTHLQFDQSRLQNQLYPHQFEQLTHWLDNLWSKRNPSLTHCPATSIIEITINLSTTSASHSVVGLT